MLYEDSFLSFKKKDFKLSSSLEADEENDTVAGVCIEFTSVFKAIGNFPCSRVISFITRKIYVEALVF